MSERSFHSHASAAIRRSLISLKGIHVFDSLARSTHDISERLSVQINRFESCREYFVFVILSGGLAESFSSDS